MSLKDENTRNGVPIIDLLYIYDFRKDRLRKLRFFRCSIFENSSILKTVKGLYKRIPVIRRSLILKI